MGMRICVVGTSNSLMKTGYVAGLEASGLFSRIDRFCIGGTASILLSLEQDKFAFEDYYACVIDTCINDEVHVRRRCFDCVEIVAHMGAFIARARAAGCNPIVLALPSQRLLAYPGTAFEVQRAVAERAGCPFFDGYAWLAPRLDGNGDAATLFRDKFHLTEQASLELGMDLATIVAKSARRMGLFDLALGGVSFSTLPVTTYAAGRPLLDRASSVRAEKFLILRPGDSVEVDLEPGVRVCGFMFNAAKTDGVLRFSGASQVDKIVTTTIERAQHTQKSFMAQLAPIRRSAGLTGRVRIELTETPSSPEVLHNSRPPGLSGLPPYIELGDLVLEHRA